MSIQRIIENLRGFEGRPSPLSDETREIRSTLSERNVTTFSLANFHINDLVNSVTEIRDCYEQNASTVNQLTTAISRIEARVSSPNEDDPFI